MVLSLLWFADNTTECAYAKAEASETTLLVAMYIMLAVIVLCAIPLVILFIQWQYQQHCRHRCLYRSNTDQANLLETTLNNGSGVNGGVNSGANSGASSRASTAKR